MDFKELKKAVRNRIDSLLTQNVYTKQAPEKAIFPYAVIKFPSSSKDVLWKQDWIIEIDFWDNTNDSSIVMEMSNNVKEGFDAYWADEKNINYRTYLEFEGEFPTEIPEMSRINQRYMCSSFKNTL
jgi:hypothetical protein